jgi:transcriptional antiterminator NusG
MIYTVRTTSGREDIVVDLLISKIRSDDIDVKSVFHPAEIKGYVFIEGSSGSVHKAIAGLMHSRGLINKPIAIGEIQHFLESKKARIKIDEGDIMEIIGGPFKGEKGRVIRVNKIKDEVTAELLEASIPIPVTIAIEFVKMVKKAKPEEKEAPVEKEEKSVFDTAQEDAEEPAEENDKPKAAMEEKEKIREEAVEEKEEKPKKRKSFLEELEEAGS